MPPGCATTRSFPHTVDRAVKTRGQPLRQSGAVVACDPNPIATDIGPSGAGRACLLSVRPCHRKDCGTMCGIVGYIGPRNATPIILGGLKRLEYRGYDSAGVAVLVDGQIEVRRRAGKLDELAAPLAEQPVSGRLGIGHTRWATHGEPTDRNAHPHTGMTGDVVVVHNGIVENFLELRADLEAEGAAFASDTDTETIVHLLERYTAAGMPLEAAAREAFGQLKGAQAIVTFSRSEPDRIVACRIGNAGGLALGLGQGE